MSYTILDANSYKSFNAIRNEIFTVFFFNSVYYLFARFRVSVTWFIDGRTFANVLSDCYRSFFFHLFVIELDVSQHVVCTKIHWWKRLERWVIIWVGRVIKVLLCVGKMLFLFVKRTLMPIENNYWWEIVRVNGILWKDHLWVLWLMIQLKLKLLTDNIVIMLSKSKLHFTTNSSNIALVFRPIQTNDQPSFSSKLDLLFSLVKNTDFNCNPYIRIAIVLTSQNESGISAFQLRRKLDCYCRCSICEMNFFFSCKRYWHGLNFYFSTGMTFIPFYHSVNEIYIYTNSHENIFERFANVHRWLLRVRSSVKTNRINVKLVDYHFWRTLYASSSKLVEIPSSPACGNNTFSREISAISRGVYALAQRSHNVKVY